MTDIVEEARELLARWESRVMLAYRPNSRLVDVVSALADECERLRAENARLREALPTEKEREFIDLASLACDRASSRTMRAATDAVDAWLARLDAAKGGLGL